MKKASQLLTIFVSTLFVFTGANTTEDKNIRWMTFEDAMAANKIKPKKIFIDLYTDWCGWCKVMDKNTFSHPEISKYMNQNYYAIKFNAEQTEDVKFNGYTFKYISQGRRGYHELASSLTNGELSYPMGVFMDENQQILTLLPGYQEPRAFDSVIKYFGTNKYKTLNYQEWEKTYKPSF